MLTRVSCQISIFLLCFFCYKFEISGVYAQVNNKDRIALIDNYEVDEIDFGTDSSVQTINDPFEKYNRKVFNFNEFVDLYMFDPIAKGYRKNFPKAVRDSVGNVMKNLSLPLIFVNSIFQGDSENAMGSFSAFLINTTLGIGGIFDVAGTKKVEYRKEDFGKTFAKYGIGQGPYLVIPLLGPSTARDFSGYLVRIAVDPLSFNLLHVGVSKDIVGSGYRISLSGISALDTRQGLIDILDDARRNSFDLYATIRSAYIQRRNFEILNKQ